MSDSGFNDSLWPESLNRYDETLAQSTENLALDEALLAAVETDSSAACLRFWESPEYCVVLGRSNRVDTEVNIAACHAEGIPILRRASGGGTVLVGPGCLCYTLALPLTERIKSLGIGLVTLELMERTARGLRSAHSKVAVHGTSDLVWNERKFSGNAQRWLRQSFVHHGTILYDFDISRMARCLNHPAREPGYRQQRDHADFVTNFPLTSESLRDAIGLAWHAVLSTCPVAILEVARGIVDSRNNSTEWHPSRSGHDLPM